MLKYKVEYSAHSTKQLIGEGFVIIKVASSDKIPGVLATAIQNKHPGVYNVSIKKNGITRI